MAGIHILLQPTDQFDTIHLGHHQVGDNQVGKQIDRFGKSVFAVCHAHYIVSIRQAGTDIIVQVAIVLHYQNRSLLSGGIVRFVSGVRKLNAERYGFIFGRFDYHFGSEKTFVDRQYKFEYCTGA